MHEEIILVVLGLLLVKKSHCRDLEELRLSRIVMVHVGTVRGRGAENGIRIWFRFN